MSVYQPTQSFIPNQYTIDPSYEYIIDQTLALSLARFKRVCVLRFDLRFPEYLQYQDPKVISRFINSFKAHLQAWDGQRLSEHPIGFAYVWCREQKDAQHWHYHVAFLFNKDAVCGFGDIQIGSNNTYSRIVSAWASAIGMLPQQAQGLVHICRNGVYWLDQRSDEFPTQLNAATGRLQYLAKQQTKQIGDGNRHMGASQKLFMGEKAPAK